MSKTPSTPISNVFIAFFTAFIFNTMYAQDQTLNIENRKSFAESNQLDLLIIPDEIVLPFESIKGLYGPNPEDIALDDFVFEVESYDTRKGLLKLKGKSPSGKTAEYIFNLDKEWGVLEMDGKKIKFKEAFGVWNCTNHSPHHACGKDPDTLKKCSEDNSCVF